MTCRTEAIIWATLFKWEEDNSFADAEGTLWSKNIPDTIKKDGKIILTRGAFLFECYRHHRECARVLCNDHVNLWDADWCCNTKRINTWIFFLGVVSDNRCQGGTYTLAVYSHFRKTGCSDLRGMIPWLTSSSRVRLCWSLSWRTAWRQRRCGERHRTESVAITVFVSSTVHHPVLNSCAVILRSRQEDPFGLKLQSRWVEEGVNGLLHTSCSGSVFCLPVG